LGFQIAELFASGKKESRTRPWKEGTWKQSVGIIDSFSLSLTSLSVSELAALAQALITLGSVNSPEQPEQLTRAT
jgi:hypothetical protein